MEKPMLHTLKNKDLELSFAPACGGSISSFRMIRDGKTFDIFRPATDASLNKKNAEGMGMFPLIPYSNRIRGGFFIYWGIKRTVPKNHPTLPDPIHGDGWRTEWQLASVEKNFATLEYTHANLKEGFPFAYSGMQTIELLEDRLKISLTIRNNGSIPMPCGLGLHPYFNKASNTVVSFKNKTVWAHESSPPRERPMKTPAEWDFESGLEISKLDLDTCFGGFDGRAEIFWPTERVRLTIQADEDLFNHVVIFSPPQEKYFCVEPVTHANDAFNLASMGVTGTGIKSLGPRESLTGTVQFILNADG